MDRIAQDFRKLATPTEIKQAIRLATRSPSVLYQRLIHGRQKAIQSQIKQLMEYMGRDISSLKDFWAAIASDQDFHTYIRKALGATYFREMLDPEFLYVIVRTLKPEVVLETGVAAGVSAAFILKALDDNAKGFLYSIDFPDYFERNYLSKRDQPKLGRPTEPQASLKSLKKSPGFAIPQSLKTRWSLKLGKSTDILPNLMAEIGKVDIFLHDSEHTYDNMMFEYTTAWDYLPKRGLLLSHDISWNNAFRDFSRNVGCKPIEIYLLDIGAIVK